MIVKPSDSGGSFEQPQAGAYPARCIRFIDLGTQRSEFKGEVKFPRKSMIAWELPTQLREQGDFAGQPFVVTKFYTTSLHEKANLRQDLKQWRGKDLTAEEEVTGFDLKQMVGAPCMLSLNLSDDGKHVNVGGVMQLPAAMPCPPQVLPSVYFALHPSVFDASLFDGFSNKLKAMIEDSPEYKALNRPRVIDDSRTPPPVNPFPNDEADPFAD